jgi:hypothetical protein
MASIINAATSGGLISTGDTSGQLQLQTGGTTALTISSGQIATFVNPPVMSLTSATGKLSVSNMPTGSVLQVVQGTSTTQSTTTSGNWDATSLSASITPTSSTNKVLIFVSGGMEGGASGSGTQKIGFKVYRGGSSIEASSNGKVFLLNADSYAIMNYIALDSPSTTSSTTYTLYFKLLSGVTAASFCRDSAETTNIILMEIAA